MIDGEVYPPTTQEVPVAMSYPSSVPPSQRLALGQEVFGLLPGLTLYSTLWLREHNRVCDVLKEVHPTWGDEQLFQTTRLIVIGTSSSFILHPGGPRWAPVGGPRWVGPGGPQWAPARV